MHAFQIDDLRRLIERADQLIQLASVSLSTHWDRTLQGFFANATARESHRISVTTTCFGLFAILRQRELITTLCGTLGPKDHPLSLDGLTSSLLTAPWTSEELPPFNIYTTPIALAALYRTMEDPVYGSSAETLCKQLDHVSKLSEGFTALLHLTNDAKAGQFTPYEPNAYLTYWCFEAFRGESERRICDDTLTLQCKQRAMEMANWGEAELYRQLSFHAASDLVRFDPTQLCYALRLYIERQNWVKKETNKQVIKKAIEVAFNQQNEDGLWPKSRPIFHFAKRGSVYPFTYETLDVLIPDRPHGGVFEPYIGKLEASLRWAEDNYIDGTGETGWRTSHLPFDGGAEGWSTAAILMSARKIRSVISAQINQDVLDDFHAQRFIKPVVSPFDSNDFYDADIPGNKQSLKEVLTNVLIAPHATDSRVEDRKYSAVFYGPPGTAKTTMAQYVAMTLGWPYIYLQTSDFAGEGVNLLIGKLRSIFDRLSLLDQAVILIDEVEEFVRDRNVEDNPTSRLLTTSMLSLIQTLRSKKSVIFIVATNFLEKFDSAITRTGGRFDMMLLIAPPSRKEKLRLFCQQLDKVGITGGGRDDIIEKFTNFFDSHFESEIAFYAFTEWKNAARQMAEDINVKGMVDASALTEILSDTFAAIALSSADNQSAFTQSQKYIRI
ncbi:MAG: ATP-binding protein [Planctomycetota bacterium]|nr:ATP-binding protein [Planctomycetota bacterium]